MTRRPGRAGRLASRTLPALVLCAAAAAVRAQPAISRTDRAVVREMLHQVRDDLQKNYYDTGFHGIDVEAWFKTADARLRAAANINEAVAIIADSLLQLHDSHTIFIPPERAVRVDYGWKMAMVGDQALVVEVTPGSDAARQGLAPGDRVLRLNRFVPDRASLWQIEYLYRFLRPQAVQEVTIRTPGGVEKTLDVRSRVTPRGTRPIDDLYDEIVDLARSIRNQEAAIGSDVLVWRMPVFGSPDEVDEAIGRAHGYKSLVLDLRDNGGGAVTALGELVSRSFDHEVLLAVERRRGKERREVAKPSRSPFSGALFVLVDSRSASAAEMFARIVQIEKRGVVIGDRTAGAVMTSRFFPHHVGLGAVAFYATTITVGDVRMSDGRSLEHVGVVPDEVLLPTPADLAAHRDPVLAHAVALAGAHLTPEDGGRLWTRTGNYYR